MREDTQCFWRRVHVLWILCKVGVWVVCILWVSKVGRINESQLAVAQLGASLGSAMQADMERALQSIPRHTCPGARSGGCPVLYLLLLLPMPLGIPKRFLSVAPEHQKCDTSESPVTQDRAPGSVPISATHSAPEHPPALSSPAWLRSSTLLSSRCTKTPSSVHAWILAECRAGSCWA